MPYMTLVAFSDYIQPKDMPGSYNDDNFPYGIYI